MLARPASVTEMTVRVLLSEILKRLQLAATVSVRCGPLIAVELGDYIAPNNTTLS